MLEVGISLYSYNIVFSVNMSRFYFPQ